MTEQHKFREVDASELRVMAKKTELLKQQHNPFLKILEEGQIYVEANLTPIYILNITTEVLMVTTAEKLSREIVYH